MPNEEQILEILERTWGYRDFLPLQRDAIDAILARRDSVLVLPTGGGKSLCYQLPALLGDGEHDLAIVVSPLIALMKDQVDGLCALGVPAAYYNSSLTTGQRSRVLERLRRGAYRLLYVSPERLAGDAGGRFLEHLRELHLRYLAIDEAHCISQWGHDFRPEYRQLGALREVFPEASVHAFTATATERVRHDIAAQLGLREPRILVGPFDRPNLIYRAQRRHQLRRQVLDVVRRHRGEAGIVYCITRREVEQLAAGLEAQGVTAVPYHAGLDDDARRRHQEAFLNERVDVVVATVAFGMGIDRSNVRYVIHAGAPRSVEHYQQEAGRAGRDGLEAECLLLYAPGDFATWRRILSRTGELTDSNRRHLRDVERYATQTRCRHRALVEYFGQTYERDGCGACDWCLGELEAVDEPVTLAQMILSCVLRLREGWGMGRVIDVLRGRMSDAIVSRQHHRLSTFGLLAERPVWELRGYVEQLLEQGWLAQHGDRYPLLAVTPEGWRLLRKEVSCELYRHREPPRTESRTVAEVSWEGVDRELFEALRGLRLEIAREREVPPYVVFHDSVLRQLARMRPSSLERLLAVPGVGAKKADDLGARFLERISEHCAAHDLELDAAEPVVEQHAPKPIRGAGSPARERAWELYAEGAHPSVVARETDRAVKTVEDYLADFVATRRPASIEPWVPAAMLERVREARADPEVSASGRLKPYYEHFGGEIPYWQIKVALAHLEAEETDAVS